MNVKTFEFQEGTVIVSVSERTLFDPKKMTIKATGEFIACLTGGTAPGIKPTLVKDNEKESEKIFPTTAAAFEAGYQLAVELGFHPVTESPKRKSDAESAPDRGGM